MHTRTLLASAAWIVAAAAPLPGCELESCTDIGCGPALSIEFVGGTWTAGDYEITVVEDGVATTCSASLPFSTCETAVTCDRSDRGFWVMQSGCALAADQQRLDGLEWTGDGPTEVSVELRRDGALLGSTSATPSYHQSYPNGEDCGPVCHQADGAVTLSL